MTNLGLQPDGSPKLDDAPNQKRSPGSRLAAFEMGNEPSSLASIAESSSNGDDDGLELGSWRDVDAPGDEAVRFEI